MPRKKQVAVCVIVSWWAVLVLGRGAGRTADY